jgi:YesN/AraC family two-component response regulator
MIVDDEKEIGTGIRDSIAWDTLGMKVTALCGDGAEAIVRVANEAPDIIISDIIMPGFNGLEMVEKLRLQGNSSKIIFISAYDDIKYFKGAFKVNAVDYILKPIDIRELCDVLALQGDAIRTQRGEKTLKRPDIPQPPGSSSVIRRIYKYVEENLGNRLTLSMISKDCYLSANYLSSLFHREAGMTINDYITARRMRRACELLERENKLYINEIARQVGYQDPAYFSRQFKMTIGCTPQQYHEGKTL